MKFKIIKYSEDGTKTKVKAKEPETCREVFRGPCHCQAGEVIVEVCRPDRPYTKERRYQGTFNCEVCTDELEVTEYEKKIIFVKKSDLKDRERLREEWYQHCEKLMKSSPVVELLEQFKLRLEQFDDKKDRCHFLRVHKLIHQPDLEFIEEYPEAKAWIEAHIRSSHLCLVLESLEIENIEITSEAKKIEELWEQKKVPLPQIGHTLFKPHLF